MRRIIKNYNIIKFVHFGGIYTDTFEKKSQGFYYVYKKFRVILKYIIKYFYTYAAKWVFFFPKNSDLNQFLIKIKAFFKWK